MRKLSITVNVLLLVASVTLELVGLGPIARSREGTTYLFIEQSGAAGFLLCLYVVFFIIKPAIDLFALISKDRGVLVEHVSR